MESTRCCGGLGFENWEDAIVAGPRQIHGQLADIVAVGAHAALQDFANIFRASRSLSSAARTVASRSWSMCRSMHSRTSSRSLSGGMESSSQLSPSKLL